jgi:hypothetical protein
MDLPARHNQPWGDLQRPLFCAGAWNRYVTFWSYSADETVHDREPPGKGCAVYRNCAPGGKLARSVTSLLWILLFCDLELDCGFSGDDLIAPATFCAVQRGVCGR